MSSTGCSSRKPAPDAKPVLSTPAKKSVVRAAPIATAASSSRQRRKAKAEEVSDDDGNVINGEDESDNEQPKPRAKKAAKLESGASVADAANGSADSKQYSIDYAPLADAARKAFAIYGGTVDQALQEFHRLMELKVFVSDIDATKLSPTPLMDFMWHAAILDTKFYRELQQKLGLTISSSSVFR